MDTRTLGNGLRLRSSAIAGIVAILTVTLAASSASTATDRAFGEYLSGECLTCHQVSGQRTGAIPAIVAWPVDQFIAVLKSYKEKQRDNQVMQTIASRLSDEEIAALAAYFGSLPAKSTRN